MNARMVDDEFSRSVRSHLPSLRRAALRLTRDASAADDLMQDTLLRAFRFWHAYTPDTHLRAWLLRIQRNAFVSQWRSEQRVRALHRSACAELPEHVDPEVPDSVRDQLDPVLAVQLDALPAEYRAVLWAVAVDEDSYREAAERLGCPVGTVMSRLHRARRALIPALRPAA
jgi:RNA polymerase sigma-70 factor (ECF subfamily)